MFTTFTYFVCSGFETAAKYFGAAKCRNRGLVSISPSERFPTMGNIPGGRELDSGTKKLRFFVIRCTCFELYDSATLIAAVTSCTRSHLARSKIRM